MLTCRFDQNKEDLMEYIVCVTVASPTFNIMYNSLQYKQLYLLRAFGTSDLLHLV